MTVTRAGLPDVEEAAPLFDAYRAFYGAPHDLAAAASFLTDRLERDESVVLLCRHGGSAVGLAQLYPLFSSTRLAPIWLLNDLFVAETARGSGAVDELLDTAATLAAEAGCIAIELSTAHTNTRAQAVYVRHGYRLDEVYRSYEKPLSHDV
jgi:GNAT superfamily N-acetyltransferase